MTDERMTLSRRKALIGLGTVGVAGAGAGARSVALLSDSEAAANNQIQAGELDLVVDYYTSLDQRGAGSDSQQGTIDGEGVTVYSDGVEDLKPDDSGTLAFCPKIVNNPGWLWVGSADGITDYENGPIAAEGDADATGDGNPGTDTNDGAGAGELSDEIRVTVSYAESVSLDAASDEITCTNTRELTNPDGYTLADLFKDLESGFRLDGNEPGDGDGTVDAYPGSSDADDQQGPCLCIEWEVPGHVGNEIMSDAIENVTIRDNTVRTVYNADQAGSAAISVQGNVDGATVKDNTIADVGVDPSGTPVNSYAFGVVIRGTGNHSVDPRNVNVVDNDVSSVLASDSTEFLGVGFGVEAAGTSYLARDNTIDDVNIGVELKAAATELILTGNSISNIDNSVNAGNNPGVPPLYLGDQTGNAPLAAFLAENSYDVAVTADGPFGPYLQAMVPQ